MKIKNKGQKDIRILLKHLLNSFRHFFATKEIYINLARFEYWNTCFDRVNLWSEIPIENYVW